MGVLRLIYGIVYGISLPLTTSMLSEIIPIKYRGKGLVIINMFVSVGKIVGCIYASICLKDLTEGNWRLMMALSSFPSLVIRNIHVYNKYKFNFLNNLDSFLGKLVCNV